MKSDFTVTCPHCKMLNDFYGDNWHDEPVDDNSDHDIQCLHCKKEMKITVHATYRLEAEEIDED